MNALRRDLFERRLWPLVALLIAAFVAVPVLVLKHPSASGAATATPPHVSLPGLPTTTTAATNDAPTHVKGGTRDPFASSTPKLASQPATPLATTTSASPSTAASTVASAPTVTPTTTTATSAMTSPTPTAATTIAPTTTATVTGATSNKPASAAATSGSSHANDSQSTSSTQSWTMYGVNVRIGTDANAPVRTDLERLTPLPSAKQPELMFMGVLAGGHKAVFALAAGVTHSGPGICRPSRQVCSEILISAGQTERITVPTTGSKLPQILILRLVAIHSSTTHSKSTALVAYERHSAAGLCDLDLAAPMSYNASNGTLSGAAGAACRKQPAQIPFPSAPSQ